MYAFDYRRPSALDEVVSLLGGLEEPKLLAGGQTLLPTLKQRLAQPGTLVDLAGIPGLADIAAEGGGVRIGAMATHARVATSDVVRAAIPALAELAAVIGDPAVRNRGTIGGSVANNDPTADYPAACLALGAMIVTTARRIPADEFFAGLFETALGEDEVIVAIEFPRPELAAYRKFRNPASRYAMAGVFVARTGEGVRVAVTGAGQSGVFRWGAAEAALTDDFTAAALESVPLDASDLMSDLHGGADYRAQLVKVMAKRAVEAAAR
ncbi:FAD binding domain-containing protein [Aquabacter spiritensis]|uniref:Carbon-monoxide dehydrogenase medium subunit n=1 Tax=Aquabacter spiritensis TaxID=933073 RepID=A0A4R3LQP7_9HYPH|nr:xanthine dehydrogenase family protein subunit M [Aquabacter spiritensis]TCT02710.1 carbon-monoxide dehydrogenase medium subunit [Aquabacter spiritensis]